MPRRPIKNKGQLGRDFKNLVKFNFKPREIFIPSKKNEQMTAEFIFDTGASIKNRFKKKRK